jgi:hypothetical protein
VPPAHLSRMCGADEPPTLLYRPVRLARRTTCARSSTAPSSNRGRSTLSPSSTTMTPRVRSHVQAHPCELLADTPLPPSPISRPVARVLGQPSVQAARLVRRSSHLLSDFRLLLTLITRSARRSARSSSFVSTATLASFTATSTAAAATTRRSLSRRCVCQAANCG